MVKQLCPRHLLGVVLVVSWQPAAVVETVSFVVAVVVSFSFETLEVFREGTVVDLFAVAAAVFSCSGE